jgi:L-lactate dehydrogenase complex protein LldE
MTNRVALFVTCIVDTLFPETGESVVELLEKLDVKVEFPERQTCCGQPALNSGFTHESRDVAKHFLEVFKEYDHIVTPSGSCATMVKHFYPELFKDTPQHELATQIASKTHEFTQFVVDVLGVTNIGASLPRPTRAAIHDACHGLRGLGIGRQPRVLLGNVNNLTLIELQGHEQCCGFGGLFAIKMSDISGAMLKDKMNDIESSEAEFVITGDASCLMHMNGGLSRNNSKKRVVHVAEVLAGRLPKL